MVYLSRIRLTMRHCQWSNGGRIFTLHPHLHCVVPGGGISPDRRKVDCLPETVVPAFRTGVLKSRVPERVPDSSAEAFEKGRLKFHGENGRTLPTGCVRGSVQPD